MEVASSKGLVGVDVVASNQPCDYPAFRKRRLIYRVRRPPSPSHTYTHAHTYPRAFPSNPVHRTPTPSSPARPNVNAGGAKAVTNSALQHSDTALARPCVRTPSTKTELQVRLARRLLRLLRWGAAERVCDKRDPVGLFAQLAPVDCIHQLVSGKKRPHPHNAAASQQTSSLTDHLVSSFPPSFPAPRNRTTEHIVPFSPNACCCSPSSA